jgi:hypothetical protein
MTGVDIIGALLQSDDAILAKVPATWIKAGRLPDNVVLPALLVRLTSGVERLQLKRVGKILMTDRVSVTVRAASYIDQTDIIQLVKDACAGKTGSVGGGEGVSILNAGTGPDLPGPGDTFEQTTDFRTSYLTTAGA